MLNESHILLQQYHNFLGFKNQIDRLSKHHLNPFLSLLLRRTMIEYTDGYVFFFFGGGREECSLVSLLIGDGVQRSEMTFSRASAPTFPSAIDRL